MSILGWIKSKFNRNKGKKKKKSSSNQLTNNAAHKRASAVALKETVGKSNSKLGKATKKVTTHDIKTIKAPKSSSGGGQLIKAATQHTYKSTPIQKSIQAKVIKIKAAQSAVSKLSNKSMSDADKAIAKYKIKQNTQKKLQNGMSDSDVSMVQNISRLPVEAQKKAYKSFEKNGSKDAGIEKGLATRTAKAEEKAAKENPALYGFMRGSAPIDTKKITEGVTGKKINTDKAEKTAAYKTGNVIGNMFNYAITGGQAEGAIGKTIAQAAAKRAAVKTLTKAAAKKGVKSVAKNVVKADVKKAVNIAAKSGAKEAKYAGNAAKLTASKASKFASRRAADVIAGSVQNAGMSASQSDNGKDFAKNMVLNTGMDVSAGTGMEVVGKAAKAILKSKLAKNAKSAEKRTSVMPVDKSSADKGIITSPTAKNAVNATSEPYKGNGSNTVKISAKTGETAPKNSKAIAAQRKRVVSAIKSGDTKQASIEVKRLKAMTSEAPTAKIPATMKTAEIKTAAKSETPVVKSETSEPIKTKSEKAIDKTTTSDNKQIAKINEDYKSGKIDQDKYIDKITEAKGNALEDAKQHLKESGTEVVTKKKTKLPVKDAVKSAFKSVQKDFVNSLQGVEDLANTFKKTNPEVQRRLEASTNSLRQAQEKATRHIFNGQMDYNEKQTGESLTDIFKGFKNDDEAKAFDEYMFNKHNIDRMEQGKPVYGEGVTAKDSELICKDLEKKYPEFIDRAKRVRNYLDNLQNIRVDSGLISKETKDYLDDIYKNYVPTYRAKVGRATDTFGNSISVKAQKAAKGVTKGTDLMRLRDQMAKMTMQTWEGAETNHLLKDIADAQQARDILSEGGTVEDAISAATFMEKDGDKYYLKFFDNGQPQKVETSKEIYEALEAHNKNGYTDKPWLDALNSAASKVATPYKKLITSLNPFFIVRNFARDFGEALIQTKDLKHYVASIPKAVKEITTKGKYYESMMNSGAGHSTFNSIDKEILGDESWFKRNIADRIERANQVVEMFPRMTEYIGTIDKYAGDIEKATKQIKNEASLNASDITVNFGRSGNIGRQLNKGIVPFFNPAMQGFSKAVRNFTGANGYKGYLSLAAKATMFGIAPSVINEMILSDNPYYQQLNARDKQNNFIFAWPPYKKNTDTFIKIPKSRIGSVFGIIPQAIASKDKQEWATMLKVSANNVAPVNPFSSNIVSPMVNIKNNKTWYGTPIESDEIQQKPAGERSDATTSALATKLGLKTGISPKKIDYAINSYGGVLAQVGLPALTPSRQGNGAFGAVTNMVKKNSMIDSAYQNNLATKFYAQKEKLQQNEKSVNATASDIAKFKNISKYQDRVSNVNSAIDKLQGSNDKDKVNKLRELTKYRNTLMKDSLNGKTSSGTMNDIDAVKKALGIEYAVKISGTKTENDVAKAYKTANGKLDENFYKGYKQIKNTDDKLKAKGLTMNDIGRAVALASVDSDSKVYDAYGLSNKGKLETASKAKRAKEYIKNGGTLDEFLKYSEAVKGTGISKETKKKLLKSAMKKLASGKMTAKEYSAYEKDLNGGSTSYVAKAIQLAKIGASNRGYMLYDIKERNIQNGVNLNAMGITPRDYRNMKNKADADGNGYPKKSEIESYLSGKNYSTKEKAALFASLATWNSSNPYGTANFKRKIAKDTKHLTATKTVMQAHTKTVKVPDYAVMRNGEKVNLKGLNKTQIAKLNLNAKGVKEIHYADEQRTEYQKAKIKVKEKIKDKSKVAATKSSSGSGYSSGYSRHYYRHLSGRSGSGSSSGSTKKITIKPAQEAIYTAKKLSTKKLTAAQIRKQVKDMTSTKRYS